MDKLRGKDWIWICLCLWFMSVLQNGHAACNIAAITQCLETVRANPIYQQDPATQVQKCKDDVDLLIAGCLVNRDQSDCTPTQLNDIQAAETTTQQETCPTAAVQCNPGQVTTCLNSQTSPPAGATVNQCRTAIATLAATLTCVETYTSGCSEADRASSLAQLLVKQTATNTNCGAKAEFTCPQLGTKYAKFEQCRPLIGVAVTHVINTWNTNAIFRTDAFYCTRLLELKGCIQSNANNCGVLRTTELADLYSDEVFLKQAIEVCGAEVELFPEIPACSEPRVATLRQTILNDCTIPESVYALSGVQDICVRFQAQIDCIYEKSAECGELADEFIRPRVLSYAMMNEKFCSNMTLAGVALKSIDKDCDYDAVYSCYSTTLLYSLTGQLKRLITAEGVKRLFSLNFYDDTKGCTAFRHTSYSEIAVCQRNLLDICSFAMPLTSSLYVPPLTVYDAATYNNLNLGPMAPNRFGIWYLEYKRGFFCYPECSNSVSLGVQLRPCLVTVNTIADTLANIAAGSNTDVQCGQFSTAMTCVGGVTRQCPIFINEVEEVLRRANVAAAVTRCNTGTTIYPADYRTTAAPPPGPGISTTPVVFRTTTTTPSVGGGETILASVLLVAAAFIVTLLTTST